MPQLDLEHFWQTTVHLANQKHQDLEVGIIVLGAKILELRKSINQEQLKQMKKVF